MVRKKQPIDEHVPQENSWVDNLMEHPIVNGIAISIVCVAVMFLLFSIADWVGFIGLIAFAIADGITIRFVINCYNERFYEELKLFASLAAVTTLWIIWTFVAGFTTAFCVVFGLLAAIVAIYYIIIAWSHFKNNDTKKSIVSTCICALLFVFSFLLLPFDMESSGNSNNSAKQKSNLEWWQASWYCQLNGLDCEICFRNATSVVMCMGGRYNKSAITRFGTYEKHGNTIIATFPGGEGNLTFHISGRQLIWTLPNGGSKTLVLYDER